MAEGGDPFNKSNLTQRSLDGDKSLTTFPCAVCKVIDPEQKIECASCGLALHERCAFTTKAKQYYFCKKCYDKARDEANAEKRAAEAKRAKKVAEEKAAKEAAEKKAAEAKKVAEEKAAKEAAEKKVAEEKAAKEAKEAEKIAAEKAAQEAQKKATDEATTEAARAARKLAAEQAARQLAHEKLALENAVKLLPEEEDEKLATDTQNIDEVSEKVSTVAESMKSKPRSHKPSGASMSSSRRLALINAQLAEKEEEEARTKKAHLAEQLKMIKEMQELELLELKKQKQKLEYQAAASSCASSHSSESSSNRVKSWVSDHSPKPCAEKIAPNKVQFQPPRETTKRSHKASTTETRLKRHSTPAPGGESSRPWLSAVSSSQFMNSIMEGVNIDNSVLETSRCPPRAHDLRDLPTFSGSSTEWPMFISSFVRSTAYYNYTDEENLLRLQKALKGAALAAVSDYLYDPESVPVTLNQLRMKFGRPEIIIDDLIEKLNKFTPMKSEEEVDRLIDLAMLVNKICCTIKSSQLTEHQRNPMLIKSAVNKLSPNIRLQWAEYWLHCRTASIVEFSEWLLMKADAAGLLSTKKVSSEPSKNTPGARRRQEKVHVNISTESQKSTPKSPNVELDCKVCEEKHELASCKRFNEMTRNQRWDIVVKNNMCANCLQPHNYRQCTRASKCTIQGCKRRHHSLLHKNPDTQESPTLPTVLTNHEDVNAVLFRMVPVHLHNAGIRVTTYAFIDEGSSISMVEDDIINALGIIGEKEELCLRWTGETTKVEPNSRKIDVAISGSDKQKFNLRGVRTVPSLNLPTQSLDVDSLKTQFPHLKKLPIHSFKNVQPRMLIGLAHWSVCNPLETIEGGLEEPVATRCRLGWAISGKLSSNSVNVAQILHACECNHDMTLHDDVKRFFSVDNFGTGPRSGKGVMEVTRAERLLQQGVKDVGGRFEAPLLWKSDEIQLPESRRMAEKRLLCLVAKMKRCPELAENLKQQIASYEEKGYVKRLSPNEAIQHTPRTWYLPLFAVTNPNKPGKVRMVWDAAAVSNGTSLNEQLLKGPDLLTPLTEVLYRFRQYSFAVSGDIREMYHQVLVKKEDRVAQRFLWQESPNSKQVTFEMNVMTFGAACSPSTAQFVKNSNAARFADQFPQSSEEIIRNHYVDDYLTSKKTVEEALQVANEVRQIHKHAHFEIRNWSSNSNRIRLHLGAEEHRSKDLNVGIEEVTKVLGLQWDTGRDVLKFAANPDRFESDLMEGRRPPTKREVLRILMMIFDPLGLIAHILVQIKLLIQELWRSNIDWDQSIEEHHMEKWRHWIDAIPKLVRIEIPRCYTPLLSDPKSPNIQLHVFVDASDAAFAAAAYLRVSINGRAEVALVGAKTKVAPQKPISIPRLELQAAVLGVRLATQVEAAHDLKLDSKTFWSDSATVLCWLKSDPRKHQQFVALRLGGILESTCQQNWRYVPTRENVADDATKWSGMEVSNDHRWFSGPRFLTRDSSEWPPNRFIVTGDEPAEIVSLHVEKSDTHVTPNPKRFSRWKRLLHAQAMALKVVLKRQDGRRDKTNQHDIIRAEQELFRYAQREVYGKDIEELRATKKLSSNSALVKLTPFLDEHDLLRVRGRTSQALGIVNWDTINPIILPKDSRVTFLLLDHLHVDYHHANDETIVNEIRQKFWIPNLRGKLRSVKSQCMVCKINRARPQPPRMADIPPCRLRAFKKPFSSTGLDYFGPIEVTVGRRHEKRWIALFTCMTVRAVYLEVVDDLTADSTIMAVRNCMVRRGHIEEIWCDNGTNFRGASNALQEELAQLDKKKLKEFDQKITWNFIPPASPHMGGSWERLVRSVKSVIMDIFTARFPKERTLRNAILEAERIVNSRPLTYVPLEAGNAEALTPNHFLFGQTGGSRAPGNFTKDDLCLRKQWRIAQYTADEFWRRWIREFLPTLTRRTKWFQQVEPLKVGDVGILWEDNVRGSWRKGRIIEVHTSKLDGQVRVVVVRTAEGTYTRPASKFAKLDVEPDRNADGEGTEKDSLHGGEDVAVQKLTDHSV